MPVVYVVQEHRDREISQASAFGEIKLLLPARAQVWYDPAPHIAKLRQGLSNATSLDYLLLMGDPALIGIACAVMAQRTAGRFNLLKWSRRDAVYVPISIDLKGEWSGDEEDFLAQPAHRRRAGGTAY